MVLLISGWPEVADEMHQYGGNVLFELFFSFFARHYLPVASLGHELSKLLEIVLVRLIKAVGHCAVDVDDRHNLEVGNTVSFTNTSPIC